MSQTRQQSSGKHGSGSASGIAHDSQMRHIEITAGFKIIDHAVNIIDSFAENGSAAEQGAHGRLIAGRLVLGIGAVFAHGALFMLGAFCAVTFRQLITLETVTIDPDTADYHIIASKEVVEEVEDPNTQMTLEEAKTYRSRARIGSMIDIPVKVKKFGRIAAINAKHVIRQGIRDVERMQVFEELQSKQGELETQLHLEC